MFKKALILIGIVFLALIGFMVFNESKTPSPNDQLPNQQGSSGNSKIIPGNTPKVDALKEQIKNMTLEEKVGQLVLAGVDGYEANENSKKLIETYHVGGFVLLKKNVRDTEQMRNLINSLKEGNATNKIPLYLALDEEGGRISRMPSEFKGMPSNQLVGTQNDENLAKRVGSILGQEVKEFGMNVNFAPVLDIFSNPKNKVIGDRSFGSKPELVSKLGIQAIKGIQEQNIISVAKHFPGHGDTTVDSHVGLPRVDYDLERLKSFELVPFANAIASGVDGIMLAHILLPKLDPNYPASFSKVLITDILRKELKFEGVVFTDDMTMGAIVENYDIGKAAVKSIQAGSDIILVCHDIGKEEAVLKALQNAAKTGEISTERLEESVYRILKLKEKYKLTDQQAQSVDVEGINQKIESLYKQYPALKG